MRYLQIGFRIFCRQLSLSLLLSLQLAIGILLTNTVVMQVRFQWQSLALLQQHGTYENTRALYQAGQGEMNRQLSLFSPFLLRAFAIALIEILRSNILYAWLEKRNFAVYYLCGAPWNRCFFSPWATACAWVVCVSALPAYAVLKHTQPASVLKANE